MQNFSPFQPVSDAIGRGVSSFYGSAPVRNVTNFSRDTLASPFTYAKYGGENLGTFSETGKFTDLAKGLGWLGFGASELLGTGKLVGLTGKAMKSFPALLSGLGLTAYNMPTVRASEPTVQKPTSGVDMGSVSDMWSNYKQNLNSLQDTAMREKAAKAMAEQQNQFSNGVNSMYNSEMGAANKAYSSELENLRNNLKLQRMGIGQEQAGAGQDLATITAQAGMDTSPSLDVAQDYLAQQAAIQELAARREFEKNAAEAQARKISSRASAGQTRQRELAQQNLTTFGLMLKALGLNQGGM
jgi:hypothetical protein